MNAGTRILVPTLSLSAGNLICLPFCSQVQPMASRAWCLYDACELGLLAVTSPLYAINDCQQWNYICIDLKNILLIKHRGETFETQTHYFNNLLPGIGKGCLYFPSWWGGIPKEASSACSWSVYLHSISSSSMTTSLVSSSLIPIFPLNVSYFLRLF